jgi:hypothetical protein
MKNNLSKSLTFYIIYRSHVSIRKELKVKAVSDTVDKWYQLKPEIFKITPEQFKNYILNLNQNQIN